ncbi:MAG TPA: hypothetical protein V6D07_17420 [Trichocoleus sp.]
MMTECLPCLLTSRSQSVSLDWLEALAGESEHESLCLPYQEVLRTIGSLSRTVASGSWTALNLDTYFGLSAGEAGFKELLLPFMWVARQRLIARVGAAYQRFPLEQRVALEQELLATLNALCSQRLKAAYPGLPPLKLQSIRDDYNRRGWRYFAGHHPGTAQELSETLLAWVDSVARLLDSFEARI